MIPWLVANTVHVQPGHLIPVTKSVKCGAINQNSVGLIKRQGTVLFQMISQRIVKLLRGQAEVVRNPVEVDTTEDKVPGTVTRNKVLHIACVGFIKIEIRIPRGPRITPNRFQEGDKTLLRKVLHFPIETLKVSWINPRKIRDALMLG